MVCDRPKLFFTADAEGAEENSFMFAVPLNGKSKEKVNSAFFAS